MKEIIRLKKDVSDIEKYKLKLVKKGKENLAYKMQKKIDYINQFILELEKG